MIQELMATIKQILRRLSVLESQIELPDMAGFLAIDGSNANTPIDIQGQDLVNVGNLGVGIASPVYPIHISGNVGSVTGGGLFINSTISSTGDVNKIFIAKWRNSGTGASDVLLVLENNDITNGFAWDIRTIQATKSIAFTLEGSGGTEFRIDNTAGTSYLEAGLYFALNKFVIKEGTSLSVGIGVTNPLGGLHTGGDRIKSTETSTTTATVSDDVETHFCNGAGAYALTLPAQVAGKSVRIINKNTGVVTLTPASGLISGAATKALNQYDSLLITSDGTNWY